MWENRRAHHPLARHSVHGTDCLALGCQTACRLPDEPSQNGLDIVPREVQRSGKRPGTAAKDMFHAPACTSRPCSACSGSAAHKSEPSRSGSAAQPSWCPAGALDEERGARRACAQAGHCSWHMMTSFSRTAGCSALKWRSHWPSCASGVGTSGVPWFMLKLDCPTSASGRCLACAGGDLHMRQAGPMLALLHCATS